MYFCGVIIIILNTMMSLRLLRCVGCGRRTLLSHSSSSRRFLFSKTGTWEKTLTVETRKELEDYWKEKVTTHHVKQADRFLKEGRQKYYVLVMFPYPSGKLHMGHVRVYTISDAMARYHRLTGKYVIHPMGWDAFGLPAENAAIERGEPPAKWTYSNIVSMKQQLESLGLALDWDREYATCDPAYYKWTQYIFLKMYEAGLVYQKEGAVNWDPVDQTVLADEQIDENGCSWRSGAKVEKKFLKQWYIKTTAYSKSLIDGLNEVDPDLWRDIIALQRHWIGECSGIRLEFRLQNKGAAMERPLSVFTTTPEAMYGASHVLLSKEHFLNTQDIYKDQTASDLQTVIVTTLEATHPFTGRPLPVYIAPKRDFGEHLDCHVGIPCCNEEDEAFAREHALSYEQVLDSDQRVINSDKFSGLTRKEAFDAVAAYAKELSCGGDVTSERARDWLISRQRYWGTPIPMMHCPKHGTMPVPFDQLPVKLPEITKFAGKGTSPLQNAEDWLQVKCPKCEDGGYARRETDTMDTFVDSSWYYLRYLDPHNETRPFSRDAAHTYMPVDLYIGGKEHAIMHLYYARFFNHFLYAEGDVPCKEPFVNLLTQGMVMGQSFKVKTTGKYLHRDQVDFSGKAPVEKDTGAALRVQWEKMSKSKYNGVDPQDVLDEFGCDATRLCILSGVAPKSDRLWSPDVFQGVLRWQNRMWSLVHDLLAHRRAIDVTSTLTDNEFKQQEELLSDGRNYFLNIVNFHMEKTFLISTAISRLHGLTNLLKKAPAEVMRGSDQFERALGDLIIMVSPFAPHFASELWKGVASAPNKLNNYDWEAEVLDQTWPVVDTDFCLPMKVEVDGRACYEVKLPMPIGDIDQLTKAQAVALAKASADYASHLADKAITTTTLIVEPGVRVELRYVTEDSKKKRHKKKMRTKGMGKPREQAQRETA